MYTGRKSCTHAYALKHTHTYSHKHAQACSNKHIPSSVHSCTRAHIRRSAHTKFFALCAACMNRFIFEDAHTNTVGNSETTYKHILICTQCSGGLLLVCPGSEDVNQPTGKSTVVTAQRLQAGRSQMCDIWSACGLDQLQGQASWLTGCLV